jgi:tetratricopeptide (TPR) repeat protein
MALMLLVLVPLPSFAQQKNGKKIDPDEAKARGLFGEAQKAYDLGQFSAALDQYSEAYKLRPLPGFLFNIAQCHRQLGNFKEASFFYGRFIDKSNPDAANVALAKELLDDSKKKEAEKVAEAARKDKDDEARQAALAQKAKADAPVVTSLVPAEVPPSAPPLVVEEEAPVYKKGWFWGVVGTVAAGAIAGGIYAGIKASQPVKTTTSLGDIDWRATP